MAKKSLIAKAKRRQKFKVREYNRCRFCGRPRSFIRKFKGVIRAGESFRLCSTCIEPTGFESFRNSEVSAVVSSCSEVVFQACGPVNAVFRSISRTVMRNDI